jgi:hypothetical protein
MQAICNTALRVDYFHHQRYIPTMSARSIVSAALRQLLAVLAIALVPALISAVLQFKWTEQSASESP